MNPTNCKDTFYYLRRRDQENGPYTLDQLRSMWQNGATTADVHYRFDPSAEWQPIKNLLPLLDSTATSGPTNPAKPTNGTLVLPIVALVFAFVPLICVVGIICGHIALKRTGAENDATGRVISIISLVVGYVLLIYTTLFFVSASSRLSEPPVPVPYSSSR